MVVGSNLARGKTFTASIGSVNSILYCSALFTNSVIHNKILLLFAEAQDIKNVQVHAVKF